MKSYNLIDTLKVHQTKTYYRRSLAKIQYVVIHHSGTTQGDPRGFAKYHVDTRGWPGIGYHYVIDKEGNVFQTQYLDTLSYHTGGKNTIAVGICCIGNFETEEVNEAQFNALKQLIAVLTPVLPDFEIKGHRDFSSTTCPGKNLYALLGSLNEVSINSNP